MYKIYKYTNIVNGLVYVGQTTKTLSERAQSNGRNYCASPRFYDAIREYGWSSFIPEIIDTALTQEDADIKEKYYIQQYKSDEPEFGYNMTNGGKSNFLFADDVRSVISANAKSRYCDPTTNPMYGKKHTIAAKEKMRNCKLGSNNPMYGRQWNECQRQKCGTKGKKLNLSDETKKKLSERGKMLGELVRRYKVMCIEDGSVFRSETDAATAYGVSVSTMNGHLKGRQKTCAGKHFIIVYD